MVFASACQLTPEEPLISTKGTILENDVIVSQTIPYVSKTPQTADVLLWVLTAETALQRKEYRLALEQYMKVIKVVDDIEIIKKTARIALFLEDIPKTEQIVLLWLAKDSNNIIARRIALTLALNKKDETATLEHLNVIYKSHPTDFNELVLDIQKVLRSEKDLALSDKILTTLAQQHPKNVTILLSQSILALRQKNLKKAHKKVIKALKIQPKWEKALRLRDELWMFSANEALEAKKFTQAVAIFKKINNKNLKFKASQGIISVLFAQKKFKAAEKKLKTLFKRYPKQRLDIFLMQAQAHDKQKNYQKAFNILTQALQEFPAEEEVLYSRSLMADKLDDLATTESDLNKILTKDPKNVSALNALGYTLTEKTTRYSEAESYLKQALALEPDAGSIIDSYGWLKFKQGDFQAALKHLLNAREKLKDTSAENETIAHIAEVLWTLNKKNEARQLIKEGMLKQPKNEHLLDVKTRLLDKEIN